MSLYEDITGKKYVEPSKKELQTIPDWMRNSQPQKKKKNKIIKKSSYLEDGYDFGDITKTILSTTGDLATNVSKGFMNTIEGTVDTARYAIGNATKNSAELQAKVWDFLGNEAYANELRKAGQNVKDYTYKNAQMNVTGALLGETNDLFQTNWSQKLNEGSAAGTLVNSVEQGIGNIGAFVGLAGIGGLAANGAGALGASTTTTNALTSLTSSNASTFVNSFTSAFGNSMSNALNSGLDEKEARGQAITSGLAEAISEQFFQGIPGLKSAGWADNLISKPIGKYFSGKTGKIALKVMDSVGEGLEEVISNVLQTTFEGIRTNKNVKDIFSELGDTIKSEETREAMISAFISSALTNGGSALITNNQKNQIIDSYAKEHDMSVKETKQLFDSLVEKKANLEDTANYKERVDLEENISKQLVKDLKADNKIDLNELFKQTPNSLKEMQFRFNQEEAKNVRTEKQNILANDMARLNDEKSNHELYKVVNAIQSANDTQQYHITTTEGLYEMGIVKKNGKGEYVMPDGSPYVPRGLNYKNGEIYINADVGSKSGTQAVYHEMFEGFKKAAPEQYNEFKQMVTDIIGEKNIQKEFDTYKAMYGEELTDDIRDEIINDKFGELAENQNFINKIADNRNVLEKLIDSVKNMIKYVKGTPEEKEFIKLQNKLEKEFAKRYKETDFSKSEGDTAYSLNEQLENQATKLTEQELANRQTARENILDFIADNNLKNPTIEEMMGAMDDYNMIDNSDYDLEDLREAEKLYRSVAQEIYNENNTKYSLTKDSQGRDLTPQQQEYFKDSKVVDDSGNLKVVYHGSKRYGHTTFENQDNVFYFTDDKSGAETYIDINDKKHGTYETYLNITNPYIFDAEGRNWNNLVIGNDTAVEQMYNSLTNQEKNYLSDLADRTDNLYDDYREGMTNFYQRLNAENEELYDKVANYSGIREKLYAASLYGWADTYVEDLIGERYTTDKIVDMVLEKNKNGANYDGIIFKNIVDEGMYAKEVSGKPTTDYVVFNSNQIKNVDNTNPTDNPDIRYSLAPVSEKTNRAKEEIGTTTDLREAGYLTADGEYLDFSGKKHGGQPGRRSMDHREIADIYTDEEYDNAENKYSNLGTATAIMQDFIEEGNIRLMPEQGIDISIEPTDAQYDKLADYIDFVKDRNGEIYIDVDKTGTGDYGSTYYSANIPASKIIRDIKEYFKTGIYPEQSDMSQFYSLTKNDNIDSKEIAPIGTTTDEIIAPIREDISNISNQLNNLSNQIKTLQNGAETTPDNEIAPVNPYRARAIAQREANQRAEEMYKDENYWKSLEEIANQASDLDEKSVRKMSRNIGKELGLKQKQIKDLQGIIQKSFDKGYSLQDIKNELDKQFGHQQVSERLDDVIDAQRELRDVKIKVSPEIQKDIADYGYWKQQYFGKIRFSNEGTPVDVAYAELSNRNPAMYPNDIINPTDQLLRIAEVADMDRKYTIDYEMDRNTIDEAANYINDTIQETLYANAMKSQTDLEKNAMQYNERIQDIPIKKRTRAEVRENLQNTMGITVEDLQVGNDIKSMSYNLTTPERVNEKVFGREVGRKINEQTVFFAKHQEAERIRFLNKELKEIADLGIKARSKESALVQQYGEGLLDDVQLAQQVSNKETQEKIKNAARVLRSKYDTYLDQINEELVDMGYDPIPKRKDYMRHFQELTDKFSQAGIPFNRQALNSENLPTDINGLTEFNVPGKNWFASAQRRTGEKTTYDAITGIDGYLQGASNLMYHTETIQRYRALENLIRNTYGQQHGLDVFGDDLTSEQAMQRIEDIQNGKLSNYAAWLKEQGNALAGKKGALDRGFERALGRRAYTLASELKKQVGSNMTGFNVRSALTNFISSTIAASKTNKLAMVKGTIDTIQNIFHDDGFIDRSDFLTSRLRGDTSISKKTWQKISNAGQIFMSGSDWFTSNIITRSKYYEGIQRGMTEDQAMNYANDFAARVMGDRSKGATAEAFNSKTLGFLTQFQLETNNQWQYFIHDTKMEFQENLAKDGGLKAGATVLFQVGQLAAYSYLFNEMFEQLTGSRAAFDILDIIKKLFGLDDDDKDKTFEERMKEAGSELVDALPFASLFGSGGRLPIGEMLTPAQTLYDYITGGTNKYGQDITLKDVSKDALESIPYYVLPTGYGQIKKTAQGLGMYTNEVPGSYTDSGNLRFTADEDTGSVIKNALFGQWSGEEAKKYRESGYSTINAKDIPLMRDLDMSSSEFRDFKKNMSEETETSKKVDGTTYSKYFDEDGNTYWYDKDTRTVYDNDMNETDISVLSLEKANASELKFNYVSNLPISEDNKQKLFDELFSNTTTDKYGYKKYTDSKNKTYWYDEDNDTLYNSKYDKVDADDVDGLTEVSESKDMANYKDYGSYAEFDYAYKNPAKYKTMKAIAGYDDYQKYKAELTTIRDNTKKDKEETFEYINSLDLTIPQKAMFLRQYYPTYRRYNNEIVNYVNSLDIDYEDKVEILESLKMKVDSKGNVSWK